ncbi:MAG: hypothetical protein EBQ75_04685, partial [Actinobacteria bacterium]|nr:hypothetical protein [Actinomycetota bacterium]
MVISTTVSVMTTARSTLAPHRPGRIHHLRDLGGHISQLGVSLSLRQLTRSHLVSHMSLDIS